MRKSTIISMIGMILIVSSISHASCWKAKIMGERENSKPKVLIGIGDEDMTLPYPPEPPEDKCIIQLLANDKTKRLTTDIKQSGSLNYEWLLLVNPHGQSPIGNTTCTLSWSLGNGFSLTDFEDNVLIDDMNQVTTYPVTSMVDQYLRYKIKYQPTQFGLSTLIRNLQILSGIQTSTWEDINCNKTIELADAIMLFKEIAK